MNMHDLLEGELLSIEWAQEKTYAGLEVLTVEDRRVRIDAIALHDVDVQMSFHPIALNAGRCTADGSPSLGEIEAIQFAPHRLTLEGDFGCIELVAGHVEIVACELVKSGR